MSEINVTNELVINGDYAKKIVPLLDSANFTINILMYDWKWYKSDFSCDVSLINSALVRAVRRGVKVRAVVNSADVIPQLNILGIVAKPWKKSKAMHAKNFVIDGNIIVIGSHNITQNAMGLNVEISVVFLDVEIAKNLTAYFDSLWLL